MNLKRTHNRKSGVIRIRRCPSPCPDGQPANRPTPKQWPSKNNFGTEPVISCFWTQFTRTGSPFFARKERTACRYNAVILVEQQLNRRYIVCRYISSAQNAVITHNAVITPLYFHDPPSPRSFLPSFMLSLSVSFLTFLVEIVTSVEL